jgi:hypothetical protein
MEGIQTVPRGSKPKETTGKDDPGKGDTGKSGKNSKGAKASKGDDLFKKGKDKSGSKFASKKRSVPPEFVKQEQRTSPALVKREPGLHPMLSNVPSTIPNNMIPAGLVPAPGNALSTSQVQRASPTMIVAPADLMLNRSFASDPQPVYHSNLIHHNANWGQSDCGSIGCCQPQYPTTPTLHPAYTTDSFATSSANPYASQLQQSHHAQPQQPPEKIWKPIKQETVDGEVYDDIFVKTETSF